MEKAELRQRFSIEYNDIIRELLHLAERELSNPHGHQIPISAIGKLRRKLEWRQQNLSA